MSKQSKTFGTIQCVAQHLRKELEGTRQKDGKKNILLFAYNGTGKTRLSMEFKNQGYGVVTCNGNAITIQGKRIFINRDTLYFNAFTEDLFSWDNDLEGNSERKLKLNTKSKFFNLLREGLDIDTKIYSLLGNFADFDFKIDADNGWVYFSRTIETEEKSATIEDIKISRGEENIFIWCFFLVIIELTMDKEIEAYDWVKYIYIDDPISSLDENNAVAVAHRLAQLLKKKENQLKTVISSHHSLFFNVLYNEFDGVKGTKSYFLSNDKVAQKYTLQDTGDTPFFYHVAMLVELHKVAATGNLYTYHFNILRIILEKTASFHGYKNFSACISKDENDSDAALHTRLINVLNHGKYSIYEPKEMLPENKDMFRKILKKFIKKYKFNPEVFAQLTGEQEAQQNDQ